MKSREHFPLNAYLIYDIRLDKSGKNTNWSLNVNYKISFTKKRDKEDSMNPWLRNKQNIHFNKVLQSRKQLNTKNTFIVSYSKQN